jgi:hypothetical protein
VNFAGLRAARTFGYRSRIACEERHVMIALLMGASVFAGVVLGWYGYKASVRIAVWGRNMDECDRIFQMANEHTDDGRLRP